MSTAFKNYLKSALLLFYILSIVTALSHTQSNKTIEDQEYDKLNNQQQSLEDNINSLMQSMQSVEKNVSQNTNATAKVMILQQAILSQREKVFNLRNQLIPPFSLSKQACLQLTNDKKVEMLDKINATKQQIRTLQQQIVNAPQCDKINSLQKDIQKQLVLIDSLSKTIYTQCQQSAVLSPTIYQTNIYANGWILGDQDIDDLIQEYYQRNIRYHNITNCPLDRPFFNGENCIICKDPNPVFNILTKECTSCPEDQEADSNLRKCAYLAHFTNFTTVDNWAKDGAPMPVPKRGLTPCPQEKPYFDNKRCLPCLMPKYWSIQKNACISCPSGQVFDVNEQKCQTPQTNDLTILQGTRWVTNDCNLTRIISQRANILKVNQTKKSYKMCPTQKPFYDGIVCINCPNQFNVDSRKCVSSPNMTSTYNQNMRCYLSKQTGLQTDPKANNYVTKSPLIDTTTPNCKAPHPYYDGTACIQCLSPFPIFNTQTKRCSECEPTQVYNNTMHQCIARKNLYVSTYDQKLMATKNKSIDSYHAQIAQKVKENPESVINLCKDPEYSNFTSCFNCSSLQYFNVQTKKCDVCDGSLSPVNKTCLYKGYLYSNLNTNSAKRLIMPNGTTVDQQNKTINSNLKSHPNSKLCDLKQPYFDGKSCTNCTGQFFDYNNSKCTPMICPQDLPFFNSTSQQCQQCPPNTSIKGSICLPVQYATNVDSIHYYVEQGNSTLDNLRQQIIQANKTKAVIYCDTLHPYYNGSKCIQCANPRIDSSGTGKQVAPYFNLKTLKCQACDSFDDITHTCPGQISCNDPTPFLNNVTGVCQACPEGTSYNPKTQACQSCPTGQVFDSVANQCKFLVTNLGQMNNNYIQQGDSTKDNVTKSINTLKQTQNVTECPTETPFFSKTYSKCINCVNPTPYFNLLKEVCQSCDQYNVDKHQCDQSQSLPRFNMNVQDFYGTIFG